ncbi:uncharacterized protein LOC110251997 [Exaiptasia diaphana]|uniref:DUF885 domain-containing protein n=1 Tax=Exaiptasia diaphana TaxID=2652724 RepID=A0A913Y367_EXADI|nr:uncharacterized protein LOC110251997 [Exaiptasia diaphana]KXJ22621.1 hypothetical protein AC249_AIPGENE26624 [Exaiptasia diaphana]
MSNKDPALIKPIDDVTYSLPKKKGFSFTRERVLAFVILVIGVIVLIVGIVLIATASQKKAAACDDKTRVDPSFSEEANRVGLGEFLDHVRKTYYKLHPYNAFYDPDVVTPDQAKSRFSVFDPSPKMIKTRTDTAFKLLKQLNEKQIDANKLKPRERRALAQMKHYLAHVFGEPYTVNYYAGDWLQGPNSFCWQPICFVSYHIYNVLTHFKPSSISDVELVLKTLKDHKAAFEQYVSNIKLGVQKGMVRSVEECKAGYDAISRSYYNVSLHGETGVLKEWYARMAVSPEYYKHLTAKVKEEWKSVHKKNINESVTEYLIEYIGKPIAEMIRYIKNEYQSHCVPSSVASGLAGLPVKYVYNNGVPDTSKPTDPTLPMTNMILNGSTAYEKIMPYFTTNDMTPDHVHDLGWKMLDILYPKVVEIAKQITKIQKNDSAVVEFRKLLNSSDSYFNDPIPRNESDENAHRLCSDLKGAQKYCPQRWKAMQMWFKEARRVMSLLDPKIVNMFYFTGPKHTTPNCPVDLSPNLNPSSGAQSYEQSDKECSKSAFYNIPFFLGRVGPRYSEWSVNAHEARPGHHLQVQGGVEHFYDDQGGTIAWLNKETYYTAFTEGWALYAENPLISEDTDTYKDEPMQRFGMLKWQLWRAIRLIVDTGLHYKGMTRAEALKLLDEKAWDGTDLAEKEITRYQSNPGQATAYMIGQIDIKNARKKATDVLGKDFDLRDFHYQVLSQGSSPLGYLSDHVQRYIECKKDTSKEGCKMILEPVKKKSKSDQGLAKKRKYPLPLRPRKVHYI